MKPHLLFLKMSNITCIKCSTSFTRKSNYKRHFQKAHKDLPDYLTVFRGSFEKIKQSKDNRLKKRRLQQQNRRKKINQIQNESNILLDYKNNPFAVDYSDPFYQEKVYKWFKSVPSNERTEQEWDLYSELTGKFTFNDDI
jgi:uncharacterized Zn-finger protein